MNATDPATKADLAELGATLTTAFTTQINALGERLDNRIDRVDAKVDRVDAKVDRVERTLWAVVLMVLSLLLSVVIGRPFGFTPVPQAAATSAPPSPAPAVTATRSAG